MNLQEIHAHVEVRRQDAEDWLAVMDQAMTDVGAAQPTKSQIAATFRRAALMLVNAVNPWSIRLGEAMVSVDFLPSQCRALAMVTRRRMLAAMAVWRVFRRRAECRIWP